MAEINKMCVADASSSKLLAISGKPTEGVEACGCILNLLSRFETIAGCFEHPACLTPNVSNSGQSAE
jgi:hypothetical protein